MEIVPYDPQWPRLFEAEKDALEAAFGDIAPEISHIGSTAVPGLSAKPVIDILLAVDSAPDRDSSIAMLAPLGYVNVPYDGDEKRLFFKKGSPRTHHVHVVKRNSWTYWKHILFRDILASDPGPRAEYEQLKVGLAEKYRDDRRAYTDAKSEFIERTVSEKVRDARRAGAERWASHRAETERSGPNRI